MISTWDVHLHLELNFTPRCVCFSVFTNIVLPNVSVMLSVTVDWNLCKKNSIFDGFYVTNQRLTNELKFLNLSLCLHVYSISLLSRFLPITSSNSIDKFCMSGLYFCILLS